MSQHERTLALIGESAAEKLRGASVAVFGVGGVGGHCIEALARAGVGHLAIFDSDDVSLSNINRQVIALHSTVGRAKVDVMKERIADIDPECKVDAHKLFYLPENADEVDLSGYDCVVDAIDTVSAKVELIVRAKAAGVRVVSAMGAGNKLDPARFEVADIEKTTVCPLAKAVRTALRKRGVKGVRVVYSKEEPARLDSSLRSPASISFVPSAAGLILASEVVRGIIDGE